MRKSIFVFIMLIFVLGILPAAAQDDFSCPGALPTRLVGSYQGRVTPGEPNNVRDEPSTAGNLVGTIPGEAIFQIGEGPVCADGYVWWEVSNADIYGWTVEGANGEYWLEPYPPVTTLEGNEIDYHGVTFTFDPALGTSIQARTYDAVGPYAEGPGWDVHPAYDEFRLVNFPVQNPGAYFEPIITIYPMEEFAAMSEYAAEQLDAMTTLLADEPQSLVDPDTPLIPIFNAARVFQTRTSYIAFQNGAGFRFITHYAQGFDVFTDENVFYTFQGLTDDGLYWVSVFMPLYTPVLPDTFDYSDDFDWDAFTEQYPRYIDETVSSLNALPADQFIPNMNLLDEMIASLRVTGG